MQDWRKSAWNERVAAAGLLMGALTTVLGLGMTTMRETMIPGAVIACVGLVLLGAAYAVYRL